MLAGTVETGINALWDAGPRIGDRVAVVGAGMVGGAIAALLRTFPLDRLQLVDVNPARSALAAALGVELVHPDDAAGDNDLVFHCSATESGLARSLQMLGRGGRVDRALLVRDAAAAGASGCRIPFPAAGDPGQPGWRRRSCSPRPANHQRPAGACHADAQDPVFDVFITGHAPFGALPQTMESIFDDGTETLCQVIDYPVDEEA